VPIAELTDFLANGGLKHEPLVCMTIDVEWAHEEVLADVVLAFDERNQSGTFFVTDGGTSLPGHERALHPNFEKLYQAGPDPEKIIHDRYESFVTETRKMAPEATGVRAHRLFSETPVLQAYGNCGLSYDSSYAMQLQPDLRPFQHAFGMLEMPIYYMDHLDLLLGSTNFNLKELELDTPGLKVLDFHPNMIRVNAPDDAFYQATKPHYHDPESLKRKRHSGRGAGDLFFDVLDYLANSGIRSSTMGNVSKAWRKAID
jgi:hypothetical protein